MKPLSPAEVQAAQANLDKSLLPDGAGHLQVAARQAFRLQDAGRTEVTLLPVQFSTSEPGLVPGINRDTDQCGLFLLDAAGKARFERMADSQNAGLIQCSGVQGLGLAHSTGAHPQVLLLFRAHTLHRTWSDPYAVSWSESDGRYVMESLSAPAGTAATNSLTIPQLRKWVDGRK